MHASAKIPPGPQGTARATTRSVRVLASPSTLELRGSVYVRIDGVDRFWSAASGRLVGWSPTHRPIDVPADVLGVGTQVALAGGGRYVAIVLEWRDGKGKRMRRIVVVDGSDGRVIAKRGWGAGGEVFNGAGTLPGVALSASGETIAHGDGRSLFLWRVDSPHVDRAPATFGTPRWVSDAMECLVDDGSIWRFHAGESTSALTLAVPRHAGWLVAADLSVATTQGHRALVRRNGSSTLEVDVRDAVGVLAPGPNGCVAAIRSPPDKPKQLSIMHPSGLRTILGSVRGNEWCTLAFSSDGARLAVIHQGRVDIHPVPREPASSVS